MALTNAEKQARWRKTHVTGRKALLSTCIPHEPLDLGEIEKSAGATLVLYNKLVEIVLTWANGLDPKKLKASDVFLALRLLGPSLESLTTLRGKITEQRGIEHIAAMRASIGGKPGDDARDVTPARPRIEETLELLRSRFEDNIKPKAN
jgi:hypothetical protein